MEPMDLHSNAQAGPSNLPSPVFPAPQPLPRPKQYLHCTQDLLGIFGLLPMYDKHVRPHLRSLPDQDPTKSKGKEKELEQDQEREKEKEGEEEGEGGEKKKKKDNYKHLIKGIPGKHPMKKDQYFQDLLKAPPKQKAHIQPFDTRTLLEGFYVTPTGLPSYNKASIEGADPREKEAKRLKRERRRAEKEERQKVLQQQQQQVQTSGSTASTPAVVSSTTPRTVGTPVPIVRNLTGTPLTKTKPLNSRSSPHPGTPLAASSRATPTPTAKPLQATGTMLTTASPITSVADSKRGIKREYESSQPSLRSQLPTPESNNQPRPPKKRRLGSGTPQPVPSLPLQQPTPHGT
ncbi:hypothetical protein Clacol_002523 [Clathrus columnatus]|uniref:Mediator of RNA polymerase II transcription subunit 19 n=1 Tax=Clathrus columnatus TaxID=1419009 RepID=A0AAV5A110_9AGAM|nr:hypothetical protein Clacol_002523 [Clathrus columnatus]